MLQDLESHLESMEDNQFRFEQSSEFFYDTMWNTSCPFIQAKNQKNKKNTKIHKNYTRAPYFICSYEDDIVHFYRSDLIFPPRHAHEGIDVVDIGLQPEDQPDLPDLINKDECSVSTTENDSNQSSDEDLPSLVNQQDNDESTAQYESDDT
jgi:hypothetical protein